MQTLHSLHPIEIAPNHLGTTVRLSRKWYDNAIADGDLELCYCHDGQHEIVGHAKVAERLLMPFAMITDGLLMYEHEKSSRRKDGLRESMKRAYGDNFSEHALCTILTYTRTD